MVRYVTQSVITGLLSIVLLALVYGVFRVWTEVPSTVFANGVATVPSYYLNRNWVWRKSGRSHLRKEVIPFWVVSTIGIILSILAAAGARHIGVKYFPDHHGARTLLVEGANMFAFAVLWIGKFLVFNRLFRHHHHAEGVAGAPVMAVGSAVSIGDGSSGNGHLALSADDPASGRVERVAESFTEAVHGDATGIPVELNPALPES
jgi:putative flippase GtrA